MKDIHKTQPCHHCGVNLVPLNDILVFDCGFYYHIDCYEKKTNKKVKFTMLN